MLIRSVLQATIVNINKQQDRVPEITHILLHSYLQPVWSEKAFIIYDGKIITEIKGGRTMPIGQRLRELRKTKHLTQAQVAEGINCTTAAYNRYETGDREPSM